MAQNDFANNILAWFQIHGRQLPWRETKDPYPIWLSEIILQQTRVSQGMAYWQRFIERYPKVEELAAASEDEVLRLWQGLGYYTRARNLHTAAQQIVNMGHFPKTLEEIKKLKGVGDYTAAAIASFAFNIPVAAVDGNVFRVLARYQGIETPINTTEGKKLFTALANDVLPTNQAASFNQAMMDFGATQCTPSSPRCPSCPLLENCVAYREGKVELLPNKLKKIKIKERHLTYIYIRCRGKVAIHRRGEGDIWQGLWEPLLLKNEPPSSLGIPLQLKRKGVKHVLTHQVLLADIYLAEVATPPQLPEDYVWIEEKELDRHALPRLIEKLIEACR